MPLDRLDRLGLPPAALDEAQQLVRRFERFHVGIELRSQPVLDAILTAERNWLDVRISRQDRRMEALAEAARALGIWMLLRCRSDRKHLPCP